MSTEGADFLLVKPDCFVWICCAMRASASIWPLAVYNVSSEYAMIKAAGQMGWIDEERLVDELLLSFKRAGADLIVTYHAKEWAMRQGEELSICGARGTWARAKCFRSREFSLPQQIPITMKLLSTASPWHFVRRRRDDAAHLDFRQTRQRNGRACDFARRFDAGHQNQKVTVIDVNGTILSRPDTFPVL
jgi:hypothetical protein